MFEMRFMGLEPDAEEPASRLFAMSMERSVRRRRGGRPESWARSMTCRGGGAVVAALPVADSAP